MKKKISYVDNCVQTIFNFIKEHNGLKQITINGGSTYLDCNATIHYECNDLHQGMMSVKSIRSGNRIIQEIKTII